MDDAMNTEQKDMVITCNGHEMQLPEGASVSDVVAVLKRGSYPRTVFLNGEHVPNEASNTTVLSHGDTLKIVFFMGGG